MPYNGYIKIKIQQGEFVSNSPFEGFSMAEEVKAPANENTEPAKPVSEAKPKATKPATSKGGASMAFRGKPVEIDYNTPEFPAWGTPYEDNFTPYQGSDYRELNQINRDLIRNVQESYRVKNLLNQARRRETEAKENYRREYNRALVGLSGSTAETRKAAAEIQCEELYSEALIASTVVEELKNNSFTIKTSIEVLNTLSNNLRAEMRLS